MSITTRQQDENLRQYYYYNHYTTVIKNIKIPQKVRIRYSAQYYLKSFRQKFV